MKATVFHEAITDWLIPWYHYIPINYDYSDMYSVLLYFFGEPAAGQPAHDDELRAIAERSQIWADTHLEWTHQLVSCARRPVRAPPAEARHIFTGCASSGRG